MKKVMKAFTMLTVCAAILTGTVAAFSNVTEAAVHHPAPLVQLDEPQDQPAPPLPKKDKKHHPANDEQNWQDGQPVPEWNS